MTAPRTARQPQDRKPKATETGREAPFSFDHAGKTYTLAPAADVLSIGWARRHRHENQFGQFMSILEALCDDKTIAVFDDMFPEEFDQFQKDFYAHNGVKLGESLASAS